MSENQQAHESMDKAKAMLTKLQKEVRWYWQRQFNFDSSYETCSIQL